MPILRRKIRPVVPAEQIRARFKSLVNAIALLVVVWAVVAVGDFLFNFGEAMLVAAIPILVLYIVACVALGRLASCFGESSTSWAFSALLFYIPSAVLAYFAFGDGVSAAYGEKMRAKDG